MMVLLFACADPGVPHGTHQGTTTSPTTSTSTTSTDAPEVATITVPESFVDPDGTWEMPGDGIFELGETFYAKYGDDYDFLVFYTERPIAAVFAFSVPVDHEIEGIGLQEVMALYGWDDLTPASAGSAGRLQHLIFVNDPTTYPDGALWDVQDVLVHEVAHRWGADLSLDAADPWVLVDRYWSHWNVHASVGGPSALGYGELLDEGGGSFRFVHEDELKYSRLELYQQGLLPAEEVGELFYVTDTSDYTPGTCYGSAWSNDCYAVEATFQGTRTTFTMDDVVARHGPRDPAVGVAPTDFRFAFVMVCADETSCDPGVYDWIDTQRKVFPDSYAAATGGRAEADTRL